MHCRTRYRLKPHSGSPAVVVMLPSVITAACAELHPSGNQQTSYPAHSIQTSHLQLCPSFTQLSVAHQPDRLLLKMSVKEISFPTADSLPPIFSPFLLASASSSSRRPLASLGLESGWLRRLSRSWRVGICGSWTTSAKACLS